ncbi:hypothetical protein FMEAI12_3330017 [Parafrankia sp. Ea1.12]|nr:hypothetical protein FMEAI12_3330017 [Parafrankia sp. Ea1.12]
MPRSWWAARRDRRFRVAGPTPRRAGRRRPGRPGAGHGPAPAGCPVPSARRAGRVPSRGPSCSSGRERAGRNVRPCVTGPIGPVVSTDRFGRIIRVSALAADHLLTPHAPMGHPKCPIHTLLCNATQAVMRAGSRRRAMCGG